MKRLKSIVLCVLAGAMLLPLTACNGGGMREKYATQNLEKLYERFDGEIEKGTANRPITLHILENDTAKTSGYLAELLNGFNEAYAEYHIIAVDANQDQHSNLADDGPYGYGPDVLYQANDALMKYCDGKHIIPLPVDKVEAYDQLPKLVKDTYTYNLAGTDYFMGVGVNMQAPMMYYRKDLIPEDFESEWDEDGNGVFDPIEDMRAMYRFGIKRHADDGNTYGYMHSLSDQYFTTGYLFTYGAYVFGDNNTDYSDIGFNSGEAYKGAGVIRQLAGVMNSGCIDDSITKARESEFASGAYFAVSNTQDMYGTLQSELINVYKKQGMSAAEAKAAADDNIGTAPIPALPRSGLLTSTDKNEELIPSVVMGGINGYAISSYTKYPKAALAFLNYATSYESVMRRNQLLGVAPARSDANSDCTYQSDVAHRLFELTEEERIFIMPSITQVDQIWTPLATAYTDLATDPYRESGDVKYLKKDGSLNNDMLRSLLDDVVQNINRAIFTLA